MVNKVHDSRNVETSCITGDHIISGCIYTRKSPLEGPDSLIFILDNKNILATIDGTIGGNVDFVVVDRECPKNLPDIKVKICHLVLQDFNGFIFVIKDSRYKEDLLMELGIDYRLFGKDCRPCKIMHYMPENIKKIK